MGGIVTTPVDGTGAGGTGGTGVGGTGGVGPGGTGVGGTGGGGGGPGGAGALTIATNAPVPNESAPYLIHCRPEMPLMVDPHDAPHWLSTTNAPLVPSPLSWLSSQAVAPMAWFTCRLLPVIVLPGPALSQSPPAAAATLT